jgi:hypothetical protein
VCVSVLLQVCLGCVFFYFVPYSCGLFEIESRLEGGVNTAKLKFSKIITTTSRVSVRNIIESAREGAKQIVSE